MISNAVGSIVANALELKRPDSQRKILASAPAISAHPLFRLSGRPALHQDVTQFSGKAAARGTVAEEKESKNLNTIIGLGGLGLALGFVGGFVLPIIGSFALSIFGGTLGLIGAAVVNGERERREIKEDDSYL